MNLKKTVAIATAVGALAAVSVPAFAFENEFHGMYRLRAMMSNFENANAGVVIAKDAPTATVFEQRARLQYIAKTSDDLKLVTHFEIDSSWGDTAYNNGRGMGGAMAADTVNLETKHVYLDFNCPLTGSNVKVGIQAITDAYKGVMVTDDMAGLLVAKKIDALTLTGGFFRLQDYNRLAPISTDTVSPNDGNVKAGVANTFETAHPIGKQNLDLYLLDGKYALSKDLTVGGAYYLLSKDNLYNAQNLHVFGVNAAAKFGNITADAFLAYQTGDALDSTKAISLTTGTKDLSAFALQAAIKADLGVAGTVRGNALYTTGDDRKDVHKSGAWQSVNSGDTFATSSNAYYDSKMMLLMRNVVNMDTDKAVVNFTNNNNHGLTLFTAGYDYKVNDKLAASANLGYALASDKKTTATGSANSASIGTELNVQVDYKLFSNLTASVQLAYVWLGDGMNKNVAARSTDAAGTNSNLLSGGKVNADDPYLTALMLNYTF